MKKLLFCLMAVLLAVNASARTVYVLSVGICDYQYINDLHKTEEDAKNISALYRSQNAHVKTLLGKQATHDNILSTMTSLFSQAEEDDAVVFFFSGHGGPGGICAYDTRSNGKKGFVTYAEIQTVIRQCSALNKQLYIDACYSGGFRNKSKSAGSSSKPLISNSQGVMLFLSSRSGEVSQENPWSGNSLFTQYLLKGLKGAADADADKIVTAKEIFNYVSSNVKERTKREQNPVMWGKFNDNMSLIDLNRK